MKDKILQWFATGRTGVSSRAMASAIAEIKVEHSWPGNHPHDPDDFNRCLLFLECVPEARKHLDKVANISDVWKNIVENFDTLEQMFLDEVGLNWSNATKASKTYKYMKSLGC